jgi:hypothetical protein
MVASGSEPVTDPYGVGFGAGDDHRLVSAGLCASGTRAVDAGEKLDVVTRIGRTDDTCVGEVRRRIKTTSTDKGLSPRGSAGSTLRRVGDDLPKPLTLVGDSSLLGRERTNLVVEVANG